ncbi:MerR family transcriptional regulator [Microbacterium aquimaris]|uniref:MerR family transcriptional regulator n=1 Tax=Microbacterium aquimaris TaxID=459816 RepID=A0ABU5N394_9MICO|nr:MerR family transcriptional regulator [Microbacterium aquimaris]MDZ8160537.1 MerR family transcriptional regulator [Microbacterium aquimaris]
MEWSIQQIARLAGTTSRTLRHYDAIGLLSPSRIGANGYRHYDGDALVRLQRILLLRELGIGLPQIAEVLERRTSPEDALRVHLEWLRRERERTSRQIASVEATIASLEGGEQMMAEKMFDGFDHSRHREEVEQRWGADAYARGDSWWRGMKPDQKAQWQENAAQLARDWVAAAESGVDPGSPEAQDLAGRHVQWLTGIPGTPAAEPGGDVKGYVAGLADMYVADPRFGANYATADGGTEGAEFVRDALRVYAEAHL